MMATERGIGAVALLCLVVTGSMALEVTIAKREYEYARGDNITLPCTFKPKNTVNPLIVVTWTSEGDNPGDRELTVVNYYSTGILDIGSKYEGRATLEKDMARGMANLKLSSITLKDNRVFECRVSIPKDDDGKLSATTRLVVLVAPSTPVCKVQGIAEYGQNLNLTCLSAEGSPPPTYTWQSRDVRNTPRPPALRTTDKGGILSLYNVSKETSGYYICTSANKIRSATCNLTLAVLPPSMRLGSTGGIIGGVVAAVALVILAIIIYCCCCKKKGDKQEEYALGVPEAMEFRDKEPVENGDGRRDDQSDYDDRASSVPDRRDRNYSDRYEERSEKEYDRRSDYDDRRSDYDDRRERYDDRRDQDDDRYDDRRDRRDNRDYDDDRRNRRDDRDYHDDSRDRYDDHDRPPSVPANKPRPRMDYDD